MTLRRALEIIGPGLLLGLALVQAGCRSDSRPWEEPQDHKVTIISEAAFVRTGQGEYVDGYLVEYESEFERRRMFMVLEIARYHKNERLIVTGRLTDDSVRMVSGDPAGETVPVFLVERAEPNIPKAPDVPAPK